MAMVCPDCNGTYEQRLTCPSCGSRLSYRLAVPSSRPGIPGLDESWQQTPWGKLFIGLVLAQGLYYGLRHLCIAGFLAAEQIHGSVWSLLTGLIVLQVLQAVSVLSAGALIGAGQRRGFLYGAVVGVWNGVLFVLVQHLVEQPLTPVSFFGEPMLQAAFGALGGLIGTMIWKPPAAVKLTIQSGSGPRVPLLRMRLSPFHGPIAWGRVLTGITLAVGGVVWADVIREFVTEASEGKLSIDTQLQAELVTWEISALALLAGAALAGSTTKNGLKQGLVVGIGSGTLLFGIRLASTAGTPQVLALTWLSSICLCLVGGWFGSQLLPPVVPRSRLRYADRTAVGVN